MIFHLSIFDFGQEFRKHSHTAKEREKDQKKDLAHEINMSSLNSKEENRYIRQKRQQGPHGVNRVLELPERYNETYAYA